MFKSEVFSALIPYDSDIGATTNSRKRRTTTLPLFSSAAKKSKRCITNSPTPPELTTTISDLPDCIVLDILCRISRRKVIFRCKCVSKRWFNIISDGYFVSRFSCRFGTKPNMTIHVMRHANGYRLLHPLASTRSIPPPIFSMNFLPFFGGVKEGDNTPIVEATFSDLVLCCATKYYQRDYYICNPITKQWIALPRTPRAHESTVPVGFICDPYYADQGNVGYRWAVVRLVPDSTLPKPGFFCEIFSSEIGEWREFQLNIPTSMNYFDSISMRRPGVAWNGKLYWYSYRGYTLELDPYNSSASRCTASPKGLRQLGVCQGRLRLYSSSIKGSITIWELKEKSGKLKWCKIYDRVPTLDMVSKNSMITAQKTGKLDVLGFLQSNEDIIYLKFPGETGMCYDWGSSLNPYAYSQRIVMCSLRENTLEKSPLDPPINNGFDFLSGVGWFAYEVPWWPTPVPRINDPKLQISQPVPRINNPKDLSGNNRSSVYLLMKRLFQKSFRWTRD